MNVVIRRHWGTAAHAAADRAPDEIAGGASAQIILERSFDHEGVLDPGMDMFGQGTARSHVIEDGRLLRLIVLIEDFHPHARPGFDPVQLVRIDIARLTILQHIMIRVVWRSSRHRNSPSR
ncbi:MAG: hypothetical protein WDN44_02830 [Sphingomonas sp.]